MNTQQMAFALSVLLLAACGEDFKAAPHPEDGGSGTSGSGGSGGSSGTGGTGATGGSSGSGATGGAGTGGSGGSAGAGGGPQCPGTHRCIPIAPDGWEGPIANSLETACGGTWPSEALVVQDGLVVTAATCECKCTPKANCPTTLSFVASGNGGCDLSGSGTALATNTCKLATALPTNGIKLAAATPGCTATVVETVPPTSWTTTHHLCGGASPGGECADQNEVCLPNPGGALCVYQQGDLACPEGYTDKHTYYTNVTDTRDCPATCNCTASGTAQCKSTISAYTGGSCQGTPSTSTILSGGTGVCFGSAALGGPITATLTGTCTPPALTATGSAEPAGAFTVCCLP